jgi:HPr kinase/phosphorylase
MRPSAISADVLFEAFRNSSLRWQWIAGLGASERRFDEMAVRSARSGADLVGYLNYIHPYRLQVLGEREIAYLTNATSQDCLRRIARIVTLEPPVLVLADGQDAPDELISMCERAHIPLFSTKEQSAFVIDVLRAYLSKHFADRITMHGVFMDILGMGVLITGESGLGKSELGLELVTRGNGWWPTMRWTCTASTRPRSKANAPSCCRTCLRCAASACSIFAPSLARRRCAARCGSSSSCIWCARKPWSANTSACPPSR